MEHTNEKMNEYAQKMNELETQKMNELEKLEQIENEEVVHKKIYNEGDVFYHLRTNYPNYVPVILQPSKPSDPPLSRNKFLAKEDDTLTQFVYMVRTKYMKTQNSDVGIYFLIAKEEVSPPLSFTMGQLFAQYNVDNKYLHIKYCTENTFG